MHALNMTTFCLCFCMLLIWLHCICVCAYYLYEFVTLSVLLYTILVILYTFLLQWPVLQTSDAASQQDIGYTICSQAAFHSTGRDSTYQRRSAWHQAECGECPRSSCFIWALWLSWPTYIWVSYLVI